MKEEIRIQYLTDDGLQFLKSEFQNNFIYYKSNNQRYFLNLLSEKQYLVESIYVVEDFRKKLRFDQDQDTNDLQNIQVVYGAMKHIPAYVAMDDRFWAGLTHTYMWDYIFQRKGQDGFENKNEEKLRNTYYNSFFTHTKNGKKRATYVNCVARLWWAGHLTYMEENRDNPFILTEELCKTGFASTVLLLSSSNILSRKESMHTFLGVIKEKREQGHILKRLDLVKGIKYLNLIAGISLLDIMSQGEMKEILDEYYTYLEI